jgi:excisionase family DNA binding protein
MSTTAEIRPGSVDERELTVIAAALARSGEPPHLVDADGRPVVVPGELVTVLRAVVEQLRAGNGVSVAPLHAELTTVEAADILGVSRPHLVKLLEQAAMPYRMVGSHRRIRLVDVLTYRDRQDAQSRHALDELTAQAEELGLYDAS